MESTSRRTGYDLKAPRRPVSLSLNSDLLSRVEPLTNDLSATVELLLGGYLESTQPNRGNGAEALGSVVEAVNALHDRNGFLSDEFSKL